MFDGSKSSTKKREEKRSTGNLEESPAGPLKNYHTGYLADPNGIRDTPLVPKRTVADSISWMATYVGAVGHVTNWICWDIITYEDI